MLLPATVMMALAAAGIAYVLTDIMTCPRRIDPALGRFEVERRKKLREASATFRLFEPWIDELAMTFENQTQRIDNVRRNLVGAAVAAPWKPTEFLAAKRIEAVLAGVAAGLFGWAMGSWQFAPLCAVGGFFLYESMAQRLLRSEAVRRQVLMKRRFASVVDLMALIMEVGAGFQEALQVAADESKGHPVGDELALVRRDINMGKRDDALRGFSQRIQDDDVTEFVMGVIEGERLGTPLAQIFRVQAEQMRQKRSQWAEKASAEAEVMLVFPAMLVMVACLIIVAAPFILTAIFNPGG